MSLQETEHRCSHCGQRLPPSDRLVVGGRERQRIVDLLAEHPYGLTRNELIDSLYQDVDDTKNPNTVSVMINKANGTLATLGWVIRPALATRGHRYVLERLERV